MNNSLLPTIQAKSDQLNAEDLIGGPITVKIRSVKVTSSDDQPVWIYYEGDNGKPFKPCKTVRRLLVRVWGDDASQFSGRSMTLFHDPEVIYGGMKVGGVRVSHMSHIDEQKTFFVTATRGKKAQVTVKPLTRQNVQQFPKDSDIAEALDALDGAQTLDDLKAAYMRFPDLHRNSEFVARKDARKAALTEAMGDGF